MLNSVLSLAIKMSQWFKGAFYLYFLLFILQNYTTVLKFIRFDHRHEPRGYVNGRGPNGREGQPLWSTTVEACSPCATAAGPTVVDPRR
jgi:hypothetical protein